MLIEIVEKEVDLCVCSKKSSSLFEFVTCDNQINLKLHHLDCKSKPKSRILRVYYTVKVEKVSL